MVAIKQRVRQTHTLVSIHPNQLVGSVIDLFFEHLELVPLGRVLLWSLDPVLQHEKFFDDKGESILHLHREERAALVPLKQELHALDVVLLLCK